MSDAFRVPLWASVLGWVVALAFLAFYFFAVHVCLRALVPSFGFDFKAFATATFGTVVMSGFVIWLVSLAELPEMWFIHRRPRRLLARGCCPNCGQLRGPDVESRCAECGVDPASIPPPYGMSWSAVRRFMVAMVIGLVLGMAAAEASILVDERRMIEESRTLGRDEWTFGRAWPATFGRVDWTADGGFKPRGLLQEERHDID
ncbi:MAG: hypothetical protein VX726_00145 [Planctomycetota bacterium]|nr:hypothetical protein [Planctomycetota bacterium]MEE2894127.1 hypothetical protein [Planctomycetota bacterium]